MPACRSYRHRPGVTEIIGLPLGGVVGDLGPRRAFHIFVGSKAPWYEICDDLLRYDELPPGPDLIHEILD